MIPQVKVKQKISRIGLEEHGVNDNRAYRYWICSLGTQADDLEQLKTPGWSDY